MGKTKASLAAVEELKDSGDAVLYTSLLDVESERSIEIGIFQLPMFSEWSQGTGVLHLFMDGLDESPLGVQRVGKLLLRELRSRVGEALNRLRLRFVCRPGLRSPSFERELQELFELGRDAVAFYELQPLEVVEIQLACQFEAIEPDSFFKWLDEHNVRELAETPPLLSELLNRYKNAGQGKFDQWDIYLDAARRLCEETDETRRQALHNAGLDLEKRLSAAAQVAFLTFCAGKNYLDARPYGQPELDEPSISIRDLATESTWGFGEIEISALLGTKLFAAAKEPQVVRWARRVLQEYLCSVKMETLQPAQRDGLLFYADGKVFPRYRTVAALLASRHPDLRERLMVSDPEILLEGRVKTEEPDYAHRLVEGLLKAAEAGDSIAYRVRLEGTQGLLSHPSLEAQLHCWQSKARSPEARELVWRIARVCSINGLRAEMATDALDGVSPLSVRVAAMEAIAANGSDELKRKLLPLAQRTEPEDEDQHLKTTALTALWPGAMTAEEMFDALEPATQTYFGGTYQNWVAEEITPHLSLKDLEVALRWIDHWGKSHEWKYPFDRLRQQILHRAWGHLELPQIAELFAAAVLPPLRDGESPFRDQGSVSRETAPDLGSAQQRRLLIEATIKSCRFSDRQDPTALCTPHHGEQVFAQEEDAGWLVEWARGSSDPVHRRRASLIVHVLFNYHRVLDNVDHPLRQSLLAAECDVPELPEVFGERWQWVDPDMEPLRQALISRETVFVPTFPQLPPEEKSPAVTAATVCEMAGQDAAHSDSLWKGIVGLFGDAGYYSAGKFVGCGLQRCEAWEDSGAICAEAVFASARKFLENVTPDGRNSTQNAGLVAFCTLQSAPGAWLETLGAATWQNWAAVLLKMPKPVSLSGANDLGAEGELLGTVHRVAPDFMREAFFRLLDTDIEAGAPDHRILQWAPSLWDTALASGLLERFENHATPTGFASAMLDLLLDRKVPSALEAARERFHLASNQGSDGVEEAARLARVLLERGAPEDWNLVWPVMQSNVLVAIKVSTQFGSNRLSRYPHLTPERMAAWLLDIETRLEPLFCEERAARRGEGGPGCYEVRDSDTLERLKWELINRLTDQGAIEQLLSLAEHFQTNWLRAYTVRTRQNRREAETPDLKPAQLLELLRDKFKRVAENPASLLDAVVESLQCLESEMLQGFQPAAFELWNEIPARCCLQPDGTSKVSNNHDTAYIPKTEIRLSEYLARYLERELIRESAIVKREPELRNNRGAGRGEQIDIDLSASDPDGRKTVRVGIEVKGCWESNPFDVEGHLVNRYMNAGEYTAALYLVGWFGCPAWEASKHLDQNRYANFNRNFKPPCSIEEVRKKFAEIAGSLSGPERIVRCLVLDLSIQSPPPIWTASPEQTTGKAQRRRTPKVSSG